MKMYVFEVSPMTLKLFIKVFGTVNLTDERFSIEEKICVKECIELFHDVKENDYE